MLVSWIMTKWFLILKHLFISTFAFKLHWKSQMLIHMTAMSDLGDALMIYSLETSTMLLNIYINLITLSIISEEIRIFVFSTR